MKQKIMPLLLILIMIFLALSLIEASDPLGKIIVNITSKESGEPSVGIKTSGGGGGGGEITNKGNLQTNNIQGDIGFVIQNLTINTSESIKENEDLPVKISYFTTGTKENLLLKIISENFMFEEYLFKEFINETATLDIVGKPKEETKAGIYNLTAQVNRGNQTFISKNFSVKIIKIPFKNKFLKFKEIIYLIILIILIILISRWIFLWSKRKKKKSVKKKLRSNKH
jgi:hypothetical protein